MDFIWPSLLFFLLLLPLLLWNYLRVQRERRNAVAQFASLGVAADTAGFWRHLPPLLFFIGIAVLLAAVARPQAEVTLPRLEGTVILTFDVSGSMSADDLKPTRMEAAKSAARAFVEKQPPGILIGVVTFSDGGISVQPPSNEREKTMRAIERLVPHRGTSLGNGLLVALNTIVVSAGDPSFLNVNSLTVPSTTGPASTPQGWYPSAVIVLLTDGENNDPPDPMIAADLAADLGVRIYTIGVGSVEGTILQVNGMTVFSQLNEPLLQNIALESGGRYYSAADETELLRVYKDLQPKLAVKTEKIEITSLFAGLAALFFVTGAALSLVWFGRAP